MNLTDIEKKALSLILSEEAPQLVDQIDRIEVVKKISSGVGFYVELDSGSRKASDIRNPIMLGNKLLGTKQGFDDILRFAVYVEYGNITGMEVFSNSSTTLPDHLEDFILSYQIYN